jgi:hypothetical protein
MLHYIHTLYTGLIYFCRPVVLCVYLLLSFPAGLSHSFQSLLSFFGPVTSCAALLPTVQACYLLCRPVTYCAALLPTVQACYLLCRPVSLFYRFVSQHPCRPVTISTVLCTHFSGLLSSVQACYPQVCLLGSLYVCYPLCKPVYPLSRPAYSLFKYFSLFRPIFFTVCAFLLSSLRACHWFWLWIAFDYTKNNNFSKLNLRSSYWMNFLSFKLK